MLKFKITLDGETHKVTAGSRDILMWERATKGASFSMLADGLAMGHLYKIAHFACMREQLFTGKLSEFEEQAELEFEGEEEEPDPTRSDR